MQHTFVPDNPGSVAVTSLDPELQSSTIEWWYSRKCNMFKTIKFRLISISVVIVVAAIAVATMVSYRLARSFMLEAVSYTHLDVYKRQTVRSVDARA